MKKKVLIINDSALLRDFLDKQLSLYGFEILHGINGIDGLSRMRKEFPDLVIMDYFLTRRSSLQILEEKKENADIKDIPVIMTASKINRENVMEMIRMGVKKILYKPVKIDALISVVSELLNIKIEMDDSPCILDAHLNDRILFIEIAKGLNTDKINLLKYKIAELLKLYKVKAPRILIMMSDIEFTAIDSPKLKTLLQEILEFVKSPDHIRILSGISSIKNYIGKEDELKGIRVVESLDKAVDGLLGTSGLESLTAEQDNVHNSLFSASQELGNELFQLNFENEQNDNMSKKALMNQSLNVAVVDDDFIVQSVVKTALKNSAWNISAYGNGKEFMDALDDSDFDLVFLDLMMPVMNGFAVLQFISTCDKEIPVIVLSAMSRKESVAKALDFGIKSYLIKPVKPEGIMAKALEILMSDF